MMPNLFEKIDRHAELMNTMGSATGADLSDAALDGRLTAEGYRHALKTCTKCTSVETCRSWLEGREGAGDCRPPEFCANQTLLQHLRDKGQ